MMLAGKSFHAIMMRKLLNDICILFYNCLYTTARTDDHVVFAGEIARHLDIRRHKRRGRRSHHHSSARHFPVLHIQAVINDDD